MITRRANKKLARGLEEAIRSAEDLLQATTEGAGDKVNAVRNRLATAVEAARSTTGRLGNQTLQAAREAPLIIKRHPYEAVGVAFGVGLLLGVLVGRLPDFIE